MAIKELCRTFGVSRQTLYRAAEAADKAAITALTKKPRGRKPEPVTAKQLRELTQQKKQLEQDLHRMSQRYEGAQTLLDLQRQAQRGEPLLGEKKNLRPAPGRGATGSGHRSPASGMADRDGGQGAGRDAASGDDVAPPSGGRERPD